MCHGSRDMTTSADASLWLATAPPSDYAPLDADIEVDVAVIGGGITGLTTALLLKREGLRVAVLEARRVGSGVTGCTSAKVSALQQTLLQTIRRHHGDDGAADYARASRDAVELVATLAREEQIECDLERRPALTYAANEDERPEIDAEYEAAQVAGLAATHARRVDLPYPTSGAVRLNRQIQFHPVRYAQGLARAVHGDGSGVFELTRVTSAGGRKVHTDRGTVTARHVVDAAHYPLLDRGLFFARLEPQRSYCIAARVRGDTPRSMSISAGSPTRSIRSYGEYVVVGGEGHPPGSFEATPERFEALETFAREHWDVVEITHRWSAQDPIAYDHLPLIGRYAPRVGELYVASGFHKWGLTSGTFAAVILTDLITDRTNPLASRFSPTRMSLSGAPKVAELGARFSADLVVDRLRPAQAASPREVPNGQARVVRDGLGKMGVYRDESGVAHGVSLRCTHLGCLLRWNGAERSWDCPCHGSRFDVDGSVLEGPATAPLERREAN